jgi:hypothetical protein
MNASSPRNIKGTQIFTNRSNRIISVAGRSFLQRVARVSTWAAATTALSAVLFGSPGFAATQDNWRMCGKCNIMFYNGYSKSTCPAGARHSARMGANFVLSYNVPETAKAQGAWRFCNKCESLFFDGYPAKGVCSRGGGHVAQGFVFVLPHDVRDRGYVEKDWRFCNKCHAMFYDHNRDKGRCSAGGGHVAQGFNFVLKFRGNLEGDTEQKPVRPD